MPERENPPGGVNNLDAFMEEFVGQVQSGLSVCRAHWDGEKWVEEWLVREEWHCEADAAGITTTHCSPENPIHSSPCGWMT